MIYTKWTRKAMKIAYAAHHGQLDKSGIPYIFHPIHVAEQMQDEDSTTVALLHDVLEDTAYTMEDLRKEGFCAAVLDALALLTKPVKMDYFDYIRRICGNPVAIRVKYADLMHNLDESRLEQMDMAAQKRVKKYRRALILLQTGEIKQSM